MAVHCLFVSEQTSLTTGAAAGIVLDLTFDTIWNVVSGFKQVWTWDTNNLARQETFEIRIV